MDMTRNQYGIAVAMALLGSASLFAPPLAAQQSMRYREWDRNRDGVLTRAEWRGTEQSFRQHDRNGDGLLSAEEVRADDGSGIIRDFATVDLDGNGHVTAQEWRRAFTQLDDNRDGSLTEDELWTRGDRWRGAPVVTRAFQAGRERGLIDGRQAGREDGARRVWDLDGQRELEQADAGYRNELGARDQYQAGYREGFRQAYAEGYGPRR
jgi:Ca2+-binding EF-hand superfamily protein